MDDLQTLKAQFGQLTIEYEAAVHKTWLRSEAIGTPLKPQALAAWREAVVNEKDICSRRDRLLGQIQVVLRELQ